MRSIIQRGVLALATVGAIAGGIGAGTASASTVEPAAAPVTAVQGHHWWDNDRCDRWDSRWNRDCYRYNRWYWDAGHHRWHHWKWDDGDRHWHDRGNR